MAGKQTGNTGKAGDRLRQTNTQADRFNSPPGRQVSLVWGKHRLARVCKYGDKIGQIGTYVVFMDLTRAVKKIGEDQVTIKEIASLALKALDSR